MRNWFGCLIPGRSVVIQQDYVHFAEWWIAVTMEYFRDCFERLGFVFGASAVYRCVRPVAPERVEAFARLDFAAKVALMHRAIERAPIGGAGSPLWPGVDAGRDRPDGGAAALSDVELGIGDPDPVQDFSGIARSNRTMVAALLARRRRRRARTAPFRSR